MLYKTELARKGMHNAKATSNNSEDCAHLKISFRSGVQVNVYKPQELRDRCEAFSFEDALNSLERMPQPPSVENFTVILHTCRQRKNLDYAKRLHVYMCKSGLETHRSLGNYLVPIWVQVGTMRDAQQVFNRLVVRNVYSWTSLITGYVECGESQHALNLYQKMQENCVHPSQYTFVALLKACVKMKDVKRGQEMQEEIARKGLGKDIVLGNTLVGMYAKCGLISKAREAFDNLPVRDVVTWTALMAGYAEHGLGEEALNCFEQMQLEGISPDALTFVCSLKACGGLGAMGKGKVIHAEIARKGLERDPFVGNTLVDMYVKCGLLPRAQEAFDKLPVRDVVSWNVLIAGYAKLGLGEQGLTCFQQMQLEGVSPNAVTLICSLKACGIIEVVDKGQELHAEVDRKGLLEIDPFVGNALVDMYAKCGSVAKAQEVFDKLPRRDVVSWSALIAGYAKDGLGEEALNCFEQMQLEGISPNAFTFVCSIKACGSIGAIDKGQEIHAEIARKGLQKDLVVGSTLVDMYGKCGLPAKGQEVFDKLPVRNEVSWNALIDGYAKQGLGEEALNCVKLMQLDGLSPDALTFLCSLKACGSIQAINKGQEIHAEIVRKGLERYLVIGSTLVDMYAKCGFPAKAREVFDKLPVRNEVSWNALIAGYAKQGLGEEALNCFKQMQLEGISPDVLTFSCILKACGSIGAAGKGQTIHATLSKHGLLEIDHCVGNALVDMYAKCGLLAKAWEVFDKLPVRGVTVWNGLIAGYTHLGESDNVFHVLESMKEEGIRPNGVTFLNILTLCSHTGLIDMGLKHFVAMSTEFSITPTIEHHTCMVDLLGRAGQFDEAIWMIKKMPFRPDLVLWHTVLGACQKWGDLELGRQAFEHAVQLDENDAVVYVLISNIYADARRQEDGEVEDIRVREQSRKKPR